MPFENRETALVRGLDHASMIGVEIGPWYNPIAPRAGGWRTVIVDFANGEALREKAQTHSAEVIRAAMDRIEDVDVVWSGQPLDAPLLALNPEGYDFLIASHVFEHIPDLIALLRQLSPVIKPDGVISLAMPDMRYCFDFYKPLTLTGDLLRAHRQGAARHAPETIFSAYAYQSEVDGSGAWLRGNGAAPQLMTPLRQAYSYYLEDVACAEAAPYVDAHAWVFVPSTFQLVILELNVLGLIDFRVRRIEEGEGSEFFVQLEHGRLDLDDDAIEAKRLRLLQEMIIEQAARNGEIANASLQTA